MFDWLTISGIRPVLLILVGVLAMVVLRYSWRNFRLDPRRSVFMRYMTLCLTAVVVLILSNHMLLPCRLGVHQLTAAPIADVLSGTRSCRTGRAQEIHFGVAQKPLCIALVLVYWQTGTGYLDAALASISQQPVSYCSMARRSHW